MTIIQALQTGRPFRLKEDKVEGHWICYDPIKNNGWFFAVVNPNDIHTNTEDIGTSLDLYREELLSDNWEIFPD